MREIIRRFIDEFMSYPGRIRIAIYIMLFFIAGFVIFGVQIFVYGLGYTDMSSAYPFGQWIIGDLVLVSLGGGAFSFSFLLYILQVKKLKPIINSTVLVAFLCYLFTFVFLIFDIGQPLRAWFAYAYPNWGESILPRSMLTEVAWCLTFYFIVLCVEMTPVVLKHKILDAIPILRKTGHLLHNIIWVFALVGTCLSFFHQASLGGGMWGVLYGKAACGGASAAAR